MKNSLVIFTMILFFNFCSSLSGVANNCIEEYAPINVEATLISCSLEISTLPSGLVEACAINLPCSLDSYHTFTFFWVDDNGVLTPFPNGNNHCYTYPLLPLNITALGVFAFSNIGNCSCETQLTYEPICDIKINCSGGIYTGVFGSPVSYELLEDCRMEYCAGEYVIFKVENNDQYTYQWSNNAIPIPSVPSAIFALAAGTYTVTVTNVDGCSVIQDFELVEKNCCDFEINCLGQVFVLPWENNFEPLADCSAQICQGESYIFWASAQGNTGPYDYAWSGGTPFVFQNQISVEDTGIYTVTVTDVLGNTCIQEFELEIEDCCPFDLSCSGKLEAQTTFDDLPNCKAKICTNEDYLFRVNVANSDSLLSYNWSHNDNPYSTGSPTISANAAGIYSVTITDDSGNICVQDFELVIEPNEIEVFEDVSYTMDWFVDPWGNRQFEVVNNNGHYSCSDCCPEGFAEIEYRVTVYFSNGEVLISSIRTSIYYNCSYAGSRWIGTIPCNLIDYHDLQPGVKFYAEVEFLSYETECTLSAPIVGVVHTTPIYVMTQEDIDMCDGMTNNYLGNPTNEINIENEQLLNLSRQFDNKIHFDQYQTSSFDQKDILVFPNPFFDELSIELQVLQPSLAQLMLYNLNGQQIELRNLELEKGNNRLEIDNLNHLPSGIYLYQILTNNQIFTGKITKLIN